MLARSGITDARDLPLDEVEELADSIHRDRRREALGLADALGLLLPKDDKAQKALHRRLTKGL